MMFAGLTPMKTNIVKRPHRENGKTLKCQHCGKLYYVSKCRMHKSRFCSRDCLNANQVAEAWKNGNRREIVCERCEVTFIARKDHDGWPKYCGQACYAALAPTPEQKECPSCGCIFIATGSSHASEDGLRKYCSVKCRGIAKRNRFSKKCISCGQDFMVTPSKSKQLKENSCCSIECQSEYYLMERSHKWKGGKYIDQTTGHRRVLLEREGFSSPYIAEHRVIASRAIGRMLFRHEYIIHINNQMTDNRTENLFICGSISDYAKRRQGSRPWPKKSNLETYESQCTVNK